MKLEGFLYEYLTCMMDFVPGEQLVQAISDWVYQGKVPDDSFPKSWASGRRFEEECKRGSEYYFKYQLE
jgi:hypothetical protein